MEKEKVQEEFERLVEEYKKTIRLLRNSNKSIKILLEKSRNLEHEKCNLETVNLLITYLQSIGSINFEEGFSYNELKEVSIKLKKLQKELNRIKCCIHKKEIIILDLQIKLKTVKREIKKCIKFMHGSRYKFEFVEKRNAKSICEVLRQFYSNHYNFENYRDVIDLEKSILNKDFIKAYTAKTPKEKEVAERYFCFKKDF